MQWIMEDEMINARNIPTPAGGPWHAVTVRRAPQRLSAA